jgi:large subunit ribosomal protein L10
MSKFIKQMEMTSLKDTFKGVRDLVVLSIKGLDGTATTNFRAALRKKKIHLHVVKNSLARKVFEEMGLQIKAESPYWAGPTAFAYGGDSVAGLSKAVDAELKDAKKRPVYEKAITIKGAVADGEAISFEDAKKRPTREEALARVAGMALSPASRLVAQILGPGAALSSQLKEIKDKAPAPAAEAPPAPQPA